ncbi:hypothetical protein [Microbacterium timonense]|jgi:hypothetical protein|uniref:hypothetical protein n=1 Tax=Microbacterium timonense TaxID=2086576 RepID=UPI00190F0794|nr:hypothetical protein [Microbacterium timonense]
MMRIGNSPSQLTETELRVRAVLNEWDPIGVRDGADNGPVDEYDDLIQPIIDAASSGASSAELAAGLQNVLTTDYGLPSPGSCEGVSTTLLNVLATD